MNHAFFVVPYPQAICLYNLYNGVASFSDNWRKDAGKIRFFYHISIEKIFDIIRRVGFCLSVCRLVYIKHFSKYQYFYFLISSMG